MLETVIVTVLKILFSFVGKDYEEYKRSKIKTLEAEKEGLESSYKHEREVDHERSSARNSATEGESDDDVFGAEKYNSK